MFKVVEEVDSRLRGNDMEVYWYNFLLFHWDNKVGIQKSIRLARVRGLVTTITGGWLTLKVVEEVDSRLRGNDMGI